MRGILYTTSKSVFLFLHEEIWYFHYMKFDFKVKVINCTVIRHCVLEYLTIKPSFANFINKTENNSKRPTCTNACHDCHLVVILDAVLACRSVGFFSEADLHHFLSI